jgi:tetratricopeptide (TPR) repeat protein
MSLSDRIRGRVDPAALCLLALALVVRLVHTLAIRESPFFEHLLVDSVDFDARAVAFLNGSWAEEGAFFQAPLYPLFLSIIYRVFGHDLLAVRAIQAVLGSLSVVLIYYIGRRCAGRAVAIAAGTIYALYAMAVHFDSEVLRPALVVFLALSSTALLIKTRPKGGYALAAFAGILLGLASIARPTALLFLPLAFLWMSLRDRRGSSGVFSVKRALPGVVFAACALVPVATVTGLNYSRSGSFVPISYNGGINFYIGNNAAYDETVGIRPGIGWDLLTSVPPVNRTKDPSGWSRHYYGMSKDFIVSDPGGYAGLLAKKTVLFWNGHEIERNTSFDHVAEYSPVMAFPAVSFRWVAPLGLLGLLIAWRRRASLGLPALFLFSQFAGAVLFFVCARYRMTAVPVLCLFAGLAAVEIYRMARGRERAAVAYLVLAAALAVGVNVDAYGISEKSFSRPDYELAQVLRREGRTDEALTLYEKAAAADPDDADPVFQAGVLMAGRGRHDEAAGFFLRAAQIEPRYARSWFNLGLSSSRAGNTKGAVDAFGKALEVLPSYWAAAVGLGDALIEEGRYGEAAGAYNRSRELAGTRGQAAVSAMSQGRAVAMEGSYEASLAHFDEALTLAPESLDALLAKARVLLVLGRGSEAAVEVRRAAAVDSTDSRVRAMMERLQPGGGEAGDE